MAASRESIAFVKEVLSDSRIHMASSKRRPYKRPGNATLVAIETKHARKSREGLIVSRKEELDDLITAFDRAVHEDHPNPERVGCPGSTALARLVREPDSLKTEPILDHLRQCAACLDELRDLRRSSKLSPHDG
jgi:hypothetical protein